MKNVLGAKGLQPCSRQLWVPSPMYRNITSRVPSSRSVTEQADEQTGSLEEASNRRTVMVMVIMETNFAQEPQKMHPKTCFLLFVIFLGCWRVQKSGFGAVGRVWKLNFQAMIKSAAGTTSLPAWELHGSARTTAGQGWANSSGYPY